MDNNIENNIETNDINSSLPFETNEPEEIEVLDDPRRTMKDVIKDTTKEVQNKAEEIKNQDIYESSTDVPVIKSPEKKKKIDKLMKVQIALIILWVVLTVAIYFFGYKLFEPIIPIS